MNKEKLINKLYERQPHLTKKDITLAVNCIIEQLMQGIANDERVEIRNFGSFSTRYRLARVRLNLITGEQFQAQPYLTCHFKPGKELREKVNHSREKVMKANVQKKITQSQTESYQNHEATNVRSNGLIFN